MEFAFTQKIDLDLDGEKIPIYAIFRRHLCDYLCPNVILPLKELA